MNFTEADLPIEINHEQMVTLGDGTTIRFETNGEAKDVYVGDAFDPSVQLFPDCDYLVETSGGTFKATAMFTDTLRVEKV
jgi:hypothetical protein